MDGDEIICLTYYLEKKDQVMKNLSLKRSI